MHKKVLQKTRKYIIFLQRVKMENKIVYNTKDVAEILKMSRVIVLKYLRQGKIKGVKFGNTWRVSNEEIMRIIKEGIK